MMMMMVVVVVMVPVAPDDDGPVVMVMMVVMGLGELHSGLCRGNWRAFINHFQRRRRIRDRLQQVGIGIGLQDVRRFACRGRRGLDSAQGADRGHRAKKSSYSLFHGVSLSNAPLPWPGSGTRV
ncbi:MAG: hypothetical protein JO141_07765 [Bradyrhizobium sp.]|nr:hypothetical protein [Bradyrhizobium sp.]